MSKTHVDEDEKQTPGSVQVIDPTDETAYEPIEIDPEVEKRVVRKIDRTILIIFSFIYMWQYLDKIALSYAVIFGMREDLNFQGQDYSWVSSIFCECHSCS
jgi:ACS family allantoate permease-like MFS transporter